MARYPCPCCGHRVHDEPPGSFMICPVCFWEDDPVQLRWPLYPGGANKPCLVDAQRTYAEIGVKEERFGRLVREPDAEESVEDGFRPVNLASDNVERELIDVPWPVDRTVLYWWRITFWRADLPVRSYRQRRRERRARDRARSARSSG